MLSESLWSKRSLDRMRMLVLLAGLVCATVSLAAPDEEALGKSRGYPTCPNAKGSFSPEWCLVGVMSLWLGIMKIGEKGGLIQLFGRLVAPFFRRVFPDIPAGHPASGSIVMNVSANMLGLDNAATPLGLKAMQELQTLNREPAGTASDAQIMTGGCDGTECGMVADSMRMRMHMLDISHAPTQGLTLMVMPQFMDMAMSNRQLDGGPVDAHSAHAVHATGGLGDTTVAALFSLDRKSVV